MPNKKPEKAREQVQLSLSHVPAGFLPDLLFNPEDGSYIFL
jgi:hypothetical protein